MKKDTKKRILDDIITANKAIKDRKIKHSRKTYIRILKLYMRLDPASQQIVYKDILKLYHSRKEIEKSAKGEKEVSDELTVSEDEIREHDYGLAKKLYADIMRKYVKLRPKEQRMVYSKILKLHHERMDARRTKPKPTKHEKWQLIITLSVFALTFALILLLRTQKIIPEDFTEKVGPDLAVMMIFLPIIIGVVVLAGIFLFSKDLRYLVKHGWKNSHFVKILLKILTVTGIFLGVVFILLFILYAYGSNTGVFTPDEEIKDKVTDPKGLYIIFTIIITIVFVVSSSKFLIKDFKHVPHELIFSHHEPEKLFQEFFGVSDKEAKEVMKHPSRKGPTSHLVDEIVDEISENRKVMGEGDIDKAKKRYQDLLNEYERLDESNKKNLEPIIAGVKKQLDFADQLFKDI